MLERVLKSVLGRLLPLYLERRLVRTAPTGTETRVRGVVRGVRAFGTRFRIDLVAVVEPGAPEGAPEHFGAE